MDDIRKSIVGIIAPEGLGYKFAGTGFLVHDNLILTCAHVANVPYQVDGKIFVQFPNQAEPVEVKRVGYSSADKDDVAILQAEKLPEGLAPLPLAESKNCSSHLFCAYGYLQQGEFEALYAKGEILERVADNQKREFLQLHSGQVMHGYSGGPVWDETEQAVVGMVTKGLELKVRPARDGRITSDQQAHFGTAFATPTEILQKVYPGLKLTKVKTQAIGPDWNLKHPYPMPPNFTGRVAERAMLTHGLNDDAENRLFILCALGGFGKSALTWQWLTHDVDIKEFPKVLWWSFYEGDSSFEHFTEETLKYLNHAVPQSKRDQVDELLRAMQGQRILLVMDGFERVLRAYSSMSAAYQGDEEPKLDDNQLDCVDVNAELFLKGVCSLPNLKSKALMTTRLTPRAVKPRGEFMLGCREEELTAMQKADAVTFFQRQKIKGTHTEIEAACEPYGYHPLSLRLLAGRILKDFDNPADIVVAQRLKIDGDIIQQKHHVLEVSYKSLPTPEQKLLSTIACFRSPVELKTLEAIANDVGADGRPPLRDQLHDLVDRGLLHFDDKNKKFDLHPIVRRYAYDRLTAADRAGAHQRLVNYFEAVPKPENVNTLEDLAPVIELYHHLVRAGNLDEAEKLFYDRITRPTYYQFGAYQLRIELLRALFLDGEDKPPCLKKEDAQAFTLNGLANAYSLSGQPRRAVPLFEMHNAIYEKAGDKKNLAIGLGNVAGQQLVIGALSAAERNLRRQIEVCEQNDLDKFQQPGIHYEMGRVYSYLGKWNESEKQLKVAEDIKKNHSQAQCIIWSYRALRFLLMAREFSNQLSVSSNQSQIANLKSSIECAQRALELADEDARIDSPTPVNYILGFWLLGAAFRENGNLDESDENLSKAINICRQINNVMYEADILLDLARLYYAYGSRYVPRKTRGTTRPSAEAEEYFKNAQEKASEALVITERSGYVLQGADVHLLLATLALEGLRLNVESGLSDKDVAIYHAKEALRLATCDGPPYYYKVAYEEAERMLEKLK